MEKTRIEELCYELYGSSKQHDSWQRYAMVRELRELMKRPKASRSDHFERSGEDLRFGGDDRRFGGGRFREGDRQTYGSSAELLDLRFREYLMSRNDDDDETDWWYRSEKKNPEDQSLSDEELFETEVATQPIETKHGTVKREANAEVISAIVKKEQMPQIQVPSSKLEHGLQIHNASPIVCEDSQYVVGCDELCEHQKTIIQVSQVKARDELLMNSKNVTNNQDAHHLFDKMPLRVQSRRGHIKCHKTWRFKFKQGKQQRGKLRSAHQLIHRGNVMYKSLCSSAKVALMKKNKFSITWPMLKDDCFIEDDQVSHEIPPLWLLIRSKFRKSKFRKFKFRNKNFQRMMREHGHFSHLKLKSDMGEDDEMFTEDQAVSMRFLLGITPGITENNAGPRQQTVYEQIKMVNEWQHQISLVLQQVMRSKKIRLSKRWWFKYRFDEEDQGILQSRTGWVQEVSAVICFLRRRHLHLHNDCEGPELAGRKRNHGLVIRVLNKLKQQRCPKSWMFKFKTDSKSARTNHILLQEKKPNKFEQVMNHTPFSVAKFGKYKDCDALLLLRPSSERFQIKHRELLVIVLEWVDTKGGFGMDKKPLHLSLRNRVWDPGGCLENLEVKVSSKEGDLLQVYWTWAGSRPIFSYDGP